VPTTVTHFIDPASDKDYRDPLLGRFRSLSHSFSSSLHSRARDHVPFPPGGIFYALVYGRVPVPSLFPFHVPSLLRVLVLPPLRALVSSHFYGLIALIFPLSL